MKLISCYIEGYGAIEKKEYRFEDGLTAFCQDNGTGKTTLASFIKAMFYGLEKTSGKEFRDREHFYPFKGGQFGGNITFVKDGKTYKIERFFGDKPTKDTVKVYQDGELTEALGEDIGKSVFGVDEDSFKRTLFIGSEDIEIKSTSDINAKLGSFLQGLDEEDGYEEALKEIQNAMKGCKSSDNRNATGIIPDLKKEIDGLKLEISTARAVQNALEEKYAKEEGLKEELSQLTQTILFMTEENERRAKYAHYDSVLAGVADKQSRAEEIARRYPLGVPSEEETLAVDACLTKEKELLAKTELVEFSIKDAEKFARLEESFVRGVPTEAQMLAVEQDIQALHGLNAELGLKEKEEPSARERALAQKFLHARPTEKDLSEIAEKVEAYKQAKKEYERIPSEISSEVADSTAKSGVGPFALVAFLLCVVGVLCFLLEKALPGVLLLCGGALLFALGMVTGNGRSKMQKTATMSVLNPEKRRKAEEIKEQEFAIKARLTSYGYHSEIGVEHDFAELTRDVEDYGRYLSDAQEKKAYLAKKQGEKQALEERLTAFFRGYGLSGDTYGKLLSDLRSMVDDYFDLKERKNAQAEKKSAVDAGLEETRLKIEAYKRKYGLAELRTKEILSDIQAYNTLCAEIEKGKAEAAAFKEKEGLTEKPTGDRVELADLQALKDEKQGELNRLEREIQADEIVAERIDTLEEMLKETEKELMKYQGKHRLLTAAKEMLEKADGNLKDRYVKPIKDEFLHYAELLEKALGKKVVMTKNFEIRFEREGAERSEKHLSAGQRSICALCFRLALIKNMYKGNQPFLVLDDPFVALDKGHMEKVKGLLRELCKGLQMVYFTCHESRMV